MQTVSPWTQVTPEQLHAELQAGHKVQLVDVREPEEFAIAQIGGVLIPLGDLPHRYTELDPELPTATLCHHGVRSARAAQFLCSMGFSKVRNISGGIDRWSALVDTSVPRY